ncbi:MAG: hypothetical protein JXM73_02380 [Anaerolineae bacterium]|nr:hypothetical protein [Anaerolineae bacterium]
MKDPRQIRWWNAAIPILLLMGLLAPAVALTQEMLPAAPMGTAFTYQGHLTNDTGDPIDDICNLRFTLYDADLGGSQIGPIVTADDTAISAGYFTVSLDFGSVFDGTALWLEVAVQCTADPGYTILSPRQALTAAPYALNADLLDGNDATAFAPAAHSHDAADITAGTLHTDRFAAYSDLTAEGYLDNGADADLLTRLQADNRFVNEGQAGSISAAMLVDGATLAEILDDDGPASGLDADLLDSQQSSFYQNASNINAGTLGTGYYSAYSDLSTEGYFDNNADTDLLTRLQADGRFVNEGQANSVTTGMIVDGTIGQADVGTNGVGADEIATDAVGAAEIAAGAVGSSEIADDSVGRADLSSLFKAQYVRVNTANANEYIWDDAWYNDSRPDIRTTGTAGQIYFDSHGGVQLHIVIIADGSKVVDTYAYTYTYTATDGDQLDIYVWPYTFIYQWFVHFVGARERYDSSNDHVAGIVMAGTD